MNQAAPVAAPLPADRKTLFGVTAAAAAEAAQTVSIPDAVRRCRWIAIDLNATEFGLFFAGSSIERPRLVPCFDSDYPSTSLASKYVSGSNGEDIVRHARISAVPCWWSADGWSPSTDAFQALTWSLRVAPLVPATDGIAFPVYAERGLCGVAIFIGRDIVLPSDQLSGLHARCFSLFSAVARIRPGEIARIPVISRRELECLKLTANGCTSEDIAKLLKLSVHTANQYLTNTAQKLNAVNRMQAVAKALRLGLIE